MNGLDSEIQICHLNSVPCSFARSRACVRKQFLEEEISWLGSKGCRGVSYRNIRWDNTLEWCDTMTSAGVWDGCAQIPGCIHHRCSGTLMQCFGKTIHVSQVKRVFIHFRVVISVPGKLPLETIFLKPSDIFIKMHDPAVVRGINVHGALINIDELLSSQRHGQDFGFEGHTHVLIVTSALGSWLLCT